jgi:uncharacterized coiled-coil protein SlyX
MLSQVLGELTDDGSLTFARRQPKPEPVIAPAPQPVPVAEALPEAQALAELSSTPVPQTDSSAVLEHMQAELAERDMQIAELQQAVIELANGSDGSGSDAASRVAVEALQERLASLESRLIEQDRTIRHTLTMLIEWIEGDDIRRTAA